MHYCRRVPWIISSGTACTNAPLDCSDEEFLDSGDDEGVWEEDDGTENVSRNSSTVLPVLNSQTTTDLVGL